MAETSGLGLVIIIILLIPGSSLGFNNSIELRHGVLFKKIEKVQFVDEQYAFYVRINFKSFIDIQRNFPQYKQYIMNEPLLQSIQMVIDKLNVTTQKLFFFVYSNFDPEGNDKSLKIDDKENAIYQFEFSSHKTDFIQNLFVRMEGVVENRYCNESYLSGPIDYDDIDDNCMSSMEDIVLLLNAAVLDIELEILTFMVTIIQTINSKVLSDHIVSEQMMTEIIKQLSSRQFYKSFVTNPTYGNIFEIYNLCKVEKILYNTTDYSLLLKINFPLQHSHFQYTIFEVIPLYTPSKNNDEYSVRLDAWWPNSKYLAISEDSSNFMTFSDYSCRYVKILNKVICKDNFEHMRNDVDYCVFSVFVDRPSKYCRYMFAHKPTQEFINLEDGVWFYSYNLNNRLKIKQLCFTDKKKSQNVMLLSPNGTGIFMFDIHCHGTLSDNSYEFMSIDRDNRTGGFRNINVDVKTILPSPIPPSSFMKQRENKPIAIIGLIIATSILYLIIFIVFILMYLWAKKTKKVVIACPLSSNNPSPSSIPPYPAPPPPPQLLQQQSKMAISTVQINQPIKTPLESTLSATSQQQPAFFGENNIIYESMDGYLTMRK